MKRVQKKADDGLFGAKFKLPSSRWRSSSRFLRRFRSHQARPLSKEQVVLRTSFRFPLGLSKPSGRSAEPSVCWHGDRKEMPCTAALWEGGFATWKRFLPPPYPPLLFLYPEEKIENQWGGMSWIFVVQRVRFNLNVREIWPRSSVVSNFNFKLRERQNCLRFNTVFLANHCNQYWMNFNFFIKTNSLCEKL